MFNLSIDFLRPLLEDSVCDKHHDVDARENRRDRETGHVHVEFTLQLRGWCAWSEDTYLQRAFFVEDTGGTVESKRCAMHDASSIHTVTQSLLTQTRCNV